MGIRNLTGPGRGATARDHESKEDGKRRKFYAEMKTSTKLEKSRQSARECRARKKLRYQYLDDMIAERERANDLLREEMVQSAEETALPVLGRHDSGEGARQRPAEGGDGAERGRNCATSTWTT